MQNDEDLEQKIEELPQAEHLHQDQVDEVKAVGAVVAPEGAQAEPGLMKIDLHCHSEASADCITPFDLIPGRCQERQVRIQAITDHNVIWGAQKLKEMVETGRFGPEPNLTVIVGEEISTTQGEIVGLFLTEAIEAGLTPEETVERIKEQGGLVMIPHGFDPLKRWRLQPQALERIAGQVDIIETFNARVSRLKWNRTAVEWAGAHECLMSAGSDAHTLADIGSAWTEVPVRPIDTPQELLAALADGVPVGEWKHPVAAYVYKMVDRARRRLAR